MIGAVSKKILKNTVFAPQRIYEILGIHSLGANIHAFSSQSFNLFSIKLTRFFFFQNMDFNFIAVIRIDSRILNHDSISANITLHCHLPYLLSLIIPQIPCFVATQSKKKGGPKRISPPIKSVQQLNVKHQNHWNTPNPVRRIMKRRTGATNFIIIT